MNELDLHNVRHHDVPRIVENYILINTTPFNIITGCSDKMKEMVTNELSKHRFQWYIRCHNAGMITVIKGEINAN